MNPESDIERAFGIQRMLSKEGYGLILLHYVRNVLAPWHDHGQSQDLF